jgi:hypothetical protein
MALNNNRSIHLGVLYVAKQKVTSRKKAIKLLLKLYDYPPSILPFNTII